MNELLSSLQQTDPRRTFRIFTVRDALKHLRENANSLRLAQQKWKSLEQVAKVSGAWPNLSLNYQRQHLFPSTGQNQLSVEVNIPLAGRTFREKDVAKADARWQKATFQLLRFQLQIRFLHDYFELCYLQHRWLLAKELFGHFQALQRVLKERVRGGQVADIDFLRFSLEMERRRLRIQRIQERIFRHSWKVAQQIGISSVQPLTQALLLPSTVDMQKKNEVSDHPLMQWFQAKSHFVQQTSIWENTKMWPDLSLFAGYLHQNVYGSSSGEHGIVFGVTLPLPFFQRNQVARQRARMNEQLLNIDRQFQTKLLRSHIHREEQSWERAKRRFQLYQSRSLQRLPELLSSSRVVFEGGGSLTTYLQTFELAEQSQQTGLSLQWDMRVAALRLQEQLGKIPVQ